MKRFVSLILIFILCQPVCIFADSSYIKLNPYPYSSHVLGEDLIIYGDTNIPHVILGLYYPDDEQGYRGYAKYILTISCDDLKNGYVIPTDTHPGLWPEGEWKIVVHNGDAHDEITILMSKEPSYNRHLRICEYTDNTLTSVDTYSCRGVQYKDSVITVPLSDGSEMRIFSWNNLSPANSGVTTLFVTTFKDGYMTDIKTLSGELIDYGNHTTLIISPTKRFEIFCWTNNLTPAQ